MPIQQRPKPIVLSEIEIQAVLAAIGDDGASRLPEGRPDLAPALVRAKRALRVAIQPPASDINDKRQR